MNEPELPSPQITSKSPLFTVLLVVMLAVDVGAVGVVGYYYGSLERLAEAVRTGDMGVVVAVVLLGFAAAVSAAAALAALLITLLQSVKRG